MDHLHHTLVAEIATQVKYFHERKLPFRIYHGHGATTTSVSFQQDQVIDTSKLNRILSVNRLRHSVLCEPNVSMEQLVHFTTTTGQIPKVVMEFKSITVGGGFAGTSGESSSFRHGYFEDTVSSIEIVLANGDIAKASRTSNEDLLHAAAGSHGTFGVVTLLEVELQPSAPYVKLQCSPYASPKLVVAEIERVTNDDKACHYVDGKIFSQDLGIVMVGELTDSAHGHEIVGFSNPWDEWFYTFIEQRLRRDPNLAFTVTVPLVDYLFRYERGAFWTGKFNYDYFWIPFNRRTRYFLDSWMKTNVMFRAMQESGLGEKYIMQDITFPHSTASQYIDYVLSEHNIAPLWLCPLRRAHHLPFRAHANAPDAHPALKEDLLINIGTWGRGPKTAEDFVKANRDIETKTRELSGGKALYARSYYTAEEFWNIYDKVRYDELRTKYHAVTLPDIFEKTRADVSLLSRKGLNTHVLRLGLMYWLWAFVWFILPWLGLYGLYRLLLAPLLHGSKKGAE